MPTKGEPIRESREHREKRLSLGDALGLTKLPKLRGERERLRDRHDMLEGGEPYVCPSCGHTSREVDDASVRRTVVNNVRCGSCGHTVPIDTFLSGRKPHGQTRGLKHFAPGGLCAPERPNAMSFGEQFVELLGEFVDAREQYAHSRRQIGGEYANSDDMNKAGDALQALLDKRFP